MLRLGEVVADTLFSCQPSVHVLPACAASDISAEAVNTAATSYSWLKQLHHVKLPRPTTGTLQYPSCDSYWMQSALLEETKQVVSLHVLKVQVNDFLIQIPLVAPL